MSSLLIIGGSGFIGGNLVKKCLKKGFKITVIYKSKKPNDLDEKIINLVHLDITDLRTVNNFFLKNYFDYIVNLSGYINHDNLLNNGTDIFYEHVNGLINIFESTKHRFPKTLIQVGTSDEYGKHMAPQKEILSEDPLTPYALAKTTCTKFCKLAFSTTNYPCIVLRPFLIFGPNQKDDRLIPYVINACLENKEFKISNGEKCRDFLYIDNFLEYIIECFDKKSLFGEVINIGSGEKRSVKSVVEYIQKIISKGKANYGEGNSIKFENEELYADIEKLKYFLKLHDPISFEEGIKKTIAYFSNKK